MHKIGVELQEIIPENLHPIFMSDGVFTMFSEARGSLNVLCGLS